MQHLAYEYAKRGAYLALVARREVSLREVGDRSVALGSPGVLVSPADVSKLEDCEKFVDDTIRYFGRRKSDIPISRFIDLACSDERLTGESNQSD